MARQPKHISEVINEAVQAAQAPVTAKLIMVQRKFDRWFVYLKGVPPKQNPSCACKTAKSAIRYMYLLQSRYGPSSARTSTTASSSRLSRAVEPDGSSNREWSLSGDRSFPLSAV